MVESNGASLSSKNARPKDWRASQPLPPGLADGDRQGCERADRQLNILKVNQTVFEAFGKVHGGSSS